MSRWTERARLGRRWPSLSHVFAESPLTIAPTWAALPHCLESDDGPGGGHRFNQRCIARRAASAQRCAAQTARERGGAQLSSNDFLAPPARALRSTARFVALEGAMLRQLVQPLEVLLQDVPGGEPALFSPLMTSACRPTSASTRVVTGSPPQPLEFRTRFRLSARRQIATITPVPITAGPKRTPQWQKAPLHQRHTSEQNLALPKKMLPRKCCL